MILINLMVLYIIFLIVYCAVELMQEKERGQTKEEGSRGYILYKANSNFSIFTDLGSLYSLCRGVV